jgi:Putative F0F1-ATPase subunit Ca2+/Mg2+ transporter
MAENGPDPRQLGWYYALAQVGFEMVVPIALGWWLDGVLGWTPWLLVIGTVLGPVLGFMHLVALLRQKPPENGER